MFEQEVGFKEKGQDGREGSLAKLKYKDRWSVQRPELDLEVFISWKVITSDHCG